MNKQSLAEARPRVVCQVRNWPGSTLMECCTDTASCTCRLMFGGRLFCLHPQKELIAAGKLDVFPGVVHSG